MLYSERFGNQWDSFVASFQSGLQPLATASITVDRVNEWYRNNSFRWSSIAENEGVLLENEKNELLKSSLLDAIREFSFQEVNPDPKPSPMPDVAVGAAAAAVIGVLLKKFLQVKGWVVAVESVVVLLCVLILYAGSLDKWVKKQRQKICAGYVSQLERYKDTLVAICRTYDR